MSDIKRQLILHCGPMKTGSTAIQDVLHSCRKALRSRGINSHHILARGLHQQMDQVLTQEQETDHRVVLLSSEFFGQVPPHSIRKILERFPAERHAIFVSRPLREIYPSLYLQNLKGSSRRITSFRTFLKNQLLLDRCPEEGLGGQIMNAPVLDSRMRSAGCNTHWLRYDRQALLQRFFQMLHTITDIDLTGLNQVLVTPAMGLSPRRSLRMELAGVARLINQLNRRGFLADHLREKLLVLCLDLSDQLRRIYPQQSTLSALDRHRCDQLDLEINQAFFDCLEQAGSVHSGFKCR